MNIIFNVGDIILQTKDNIVFTVIKKDRKHIYLEYYDKPFGDNRIFEITREKLKYQFEIKAEFLKLIRVTK